MSYAQVVVDIPARAVASPFTYAVPSELEGTVVAGCCVLVSFARRPAVGYVLRVTHEPPASVDPARLVAVERVLSEPFFTQSAGGVIEWMAREYAAPLAETARLFCPPGFSAKMVRDETSGLWALQQARVAAADDRWVALGGAAAGYTPRANARVERRLLQMLQDGPVRQVELACELPGAAGAVSRLAKKGVVEVEHRRRWRGAEEASAGGALLSSASAPPRSAGELTRGQARAVEAILDACRAADGSCVVLDGVTGSGKTEVYLIAIADVLARGRGAYVLVPEISLTPQTVGRFRSRFGAAVAVLHSRLSTAERYDQWEMVRTGVARVVVGARSALFAPLPNPGIYIIDEEHESSYKQSSSPRYHARDVAAHMARENGAALVLGSATPSLEALARCDAGQWRGASWRRVEMPDRPASRPLPPVQVVDMAREFAQGHRKMFSRALMAALQEVVEHGEKAVLLLNQRGFARFLLCRDCGHVPQCERCSTSLTYHEAGGAGKLMCHTCGREYPVPPVCPECGSHFLRRLGKGTQQVEAQLRELLPPGFAVVRMDADTTKGKDGHAARLQEFDEAPSAVLLGTQMIAKGLDFPEVTLVGVVNADTVLKVCDFRAAERTYDLLEQVAGRAGRGERPGRVIIQTYQGTHPAITAAATHDRSDFVAGELALRGEAGYPPFARLANVLIWGADAAAVGEVSSAAADLLRTAAKDAPAQQGLLFDDDQAAGSIGPVEVLGPVDCVVSRADGRFRRHVIVRAEPDAELGEFIGKALRRLPARPGVSVAVDVDPYDMM